MRVLLALLLLLLLAVALPAYTSARLPRAPRQPGAIPAGGGVVMRVAVDVQLGCRDAAAAGNNNGAYGAFVRAGDAVEVRAVLTEDVDGCALPEGGVDAAVHRQVGGVWVQVQTTGGDVGEMPLAALAGADDVLSTVDMSQEWRYYPDEVNDCVAPSSTRRNRVPVTDGICMAALQQPLDDATMAFAVVEPVNVAGTYGKHPRGVLPWPDASYERLSYDPNTGGKPVVYVAGPACANANETFIALHGGGFVSRQLAQRYTCDTGLWRYQAYPGPKGYGGMLIPSYFWVDTEDVAVPVPVPIYSLSDATTPSYWGEYSAGSYYNNYYAGY